MSYCKADCENCGYGKSCGCKGCAETNGCPFGKSCFIADYIKVGGAAAYEEFKKQLIGEINALRVEGMPEIKELYALNGAFVNLAYPMPNGEQVKLLDDSAIYLGNQVEYEFSNGQADRCIGIVSNMEFILICEYGENGSDPAILLYKKR